MHPIGDDDGVSAIRGRKHGQQRAQEHDTHAPLGTQGQPTLKWHTRRTILRGPTVIRQCRVIGGLDTVRAP